MPIAMLLILIGIMATLVPVTYVGINLERKLSLHEEPLIATLAQMPHGMLATLGDIKESNDPTRGLAERISIWYFLQRPKSVILLAVFIVQFCLFVISIVAYHYRFM